MYVCVCVPESVCSSVWHLLRGQSSLEQPSNYGGHGVTVEMRENCNWIMTHQSWNLSLDTHKDTRVCTHTRARTGRAPTCDYKPADPSPASSYGATMSHFSLSCSHYSSETLRAPSLTAKITFVSYLNMFLCIFYLFFCSFGVKKIAFKLVFKA